MNTIFYGQAIRVEPPLNHPPCGQLFVIFCWVPAKKGVFRSKNTVLALFNVFWIGQNIQICLWSEKSGLTPSPSHGQPDRKISVFTTSLQQEAFSCLKTTVTVLLSITKEYQYKSRCDEQRGFA